jgi:PAS domain S-box-containing protein
MIFLMVGLILISYFLAFRLQKILSIPILKLANVIQEISERGNFLVRVEKEGNDEIGALYDGFNEMMGHIQMRKQERDKAEEELRKHRERLEELVKERTSELEEKTKELENEVAIRKLIDKKLRTEKAYIDQLFESAQEAIVVVDKNSRALRVNREFLELFGYTINEVLGSSIDDLIAPKEYYDEAASVTKKILEGEKIGFETVRRRKDGTLFNVSVLASPIIVDDELVAIYGIYRDITKLKRAEEALVEAKHTAESANRAKSDFLANMSHELRTPLNAIIGFSQALQEQYFGALNKKQIDYIIDILESGQHLLAMINDILDLSKIEAGKMELELSKVKIKDLLANSLIMIKERCFKHGISLDLHFSQDLDNLEFIADERKLKQIMFNLLSNAAKFTPEGGEIKVEARREGKDFLISVSDTGIGIVSENQGKVFESFYQVNSKQEGKTPGTGLGLPLTKRLVEMQEGRIWMESEGKAKGSCFSFSVPIRKSVQKGKSEIKKRKKSNSHEQKG